MTAAAGILLLGFASVAAVNGDQPEPATSAAPRPTLDAPAPSFDVVRISAQGHAVMAGRAAAGAAVVVSDGATELGRTVADDRGEWVFLPDAPLPSGARRLALRAERAGEPPVHGAEPLEVVVPERGAAADVLSVGMAEMR